MLSVRPRLQRQDQIDPTLLLDLESTEGQFYEHVEAQKFLAGIKKPVEKYVLGIFSVKNWTA